MFFPHEFPWKTAEAHVICSFLLLLGLLCLGHDIGFARQPESDPQGRPLYYQGMISIMVKENMGPFPQQEGVVTFGVESLDALSRKFEANSLQQLFQHRQIPRGSNLPDLSRLYKLTFPSSNDVQTVVEEFANNKHIEFAEPIPIAYPTEVPDDPLYGQLQHLPQIMAENAWDIHHGEDGAESIVIAIVDTGVDYNHPDLTDNLWQNLGEDADGDGVTLVFDFPGWVLDPGDLNGIDDDGNGYIDDLIGWDFFNNFEGEDNIPAPVNGHGTFCAGIGAGVTNNGVGIASVSWNVKFMATKHNNGTDNYIHHAYDGIIYAAENGASIISNSWGHSLYTQATQLAVEYASGLGSIIVAAAGNQNSDLYNYPGAYPQVVSVAAVASTDEKTSYSSYGMAVDISAPGGEPDIDGGITSTVIGGGYQAGGWGTSFATPMVAGLLALVKSYHPEWTNEQIVTQVLGTADNIDAINPGYEDMLGSGRLNAYRALSEAGVTLADELRVDLFDVRPLDEDGDGFLEAGEMVDLDLTIRNYAHYVGASEATLTLTTTDPDIVILSDTYQGSIPADDYLNIEGVFQIQINESASAHFATLNLHLESNVPIVFGENMEFELMLAPGGILVFEPAERNWDFSGAFIRDFLQECGFEVLYTNTIPASLSPFEAVFMSMGTESFYLNLGDAYYPTESEMTALIDYLQGGGNMYVEGVFLSTLSINGSPDLNAIKELLSISSLTHALFTNPIDDLQGQVSSLAEGMMFTASMQNYTCHINDLVANENGVTVFTEEGDVVAGVQGTGAYGQKTVYLSYPVEPMVDNDLFSNRGELILRIIDFFGIGRPAGYIAANYKTDRWSGSLPLTVQFTDLSLCDELEPISAWQWDFNNDGIIDSNDQNPTWVFEDTGFHSVKLTVSNGSSTSQLLLEEEILVNDEVLLVWEGIQGGADYSGTFIRDLWEGDGNYIPQLPVVYCTRFPDSFAGCSAVFLSFGSINSKYTVMYEYMALPLESYLESGGRAYIEGAQAIFDVQTYHPSLHAYLGLLGVSNGSYNELLNLEGQSGSIMEGIDFTASDQAGYSSIDKYYTNETGVVAFTEAGYGNVAVQNEGENGQRTFCLSYSLADLVDGGYPNQRENVLAKLCQFFDVPLVALAIEDEQILPTATTLLDNYPNPFNPVTVIGFSLPREQHVRLRIYSLAGMHVATLLDSAIPAGTTRVAWDGCDKAGKSAASGVYFYRLETEGFSETKRMMLLK